MSARKIVRETLGHTVSRRQMLGLIGAGVVGSVAASSSGAAQATGGPVEVDGLVAETQTAAATADVEVLSGGVVGRREPITNIDCPIAVGQTLSGTDHLAIDDPSGPTNSNLTAIETAGGGGWSQAANARFIQSGSVTQEFDDSDIYIARGGDWVQINDAGPAIPDSDANHQWHFNEGSGTLVEDHIGSLDASFNSLGWASDTGAYGYYADLSGSAANLGSTGEAALSHWTEDNEGTFLAWVKPDALTGFPGIFGIGGGTGRVGFAARQSSGQIQILLGDGSDTSTVESSLSGTTWHAIAAVADGANLSAYIAQPSGYTLSNTQTDSVPGTTPSSWSDTPHIGYDPNLGNYFDGGLGIMFSDDEAWSQSALQDFVDETKGYYD